MWSYTHVPTLLSGPSSLPCITNGTMLNESNGVGGEEKINTRGMIGCPSEYYTWYQQESG